MKKFSVAFVALMLMMDVVCQAQVFDAGRLEYSHGEFYLNGELLQPDQIRAVIGDDIYYDTYQTAIPQRRAGLTLTIAGGSSLGTGVALVAVGYASAFKAALDLRSGSGNPSESSFRARVAVSEQIVLGGVIFVLVGSSLVSVGVPLLAIGSSRLRWIQEEYNHNAGYSLNFGFTPNGVGLALNF